jgi:hypothetical protein
MPPQCARMGHAATTRDPLIRTPPVQSGAIAAVSGLEGGTSLSRGCANTDAHLHGTSTHRAARAQPTRSDSEMTIDTNASDWPLILVGPMVRRVEADAVSVFVVCKHPRTVRLSIYEGTNPVAARLVHEHDDHTVELGRFLHVAVVTARPTSPLRPGRVYGYNLRLTAATENGDRGAAAVADLRSLGLLNRLGYEPDGLPGFVIPPTRLKDVRIAHGSCRKPHGERRDALATLDQILAGSHDDPAARPQQLFLTGDQIYADDVHPAVLALAGSVGRVALGWEHAEHLPDVGPDDFALQPTRRGTLVRGRAGFSGPVLHSHLMSLAEFCGMYLLVWSDELWPRNETGDLTLLPTDAVLDHPAWGATANRRAHRRAVALACRAESHLGEFTHTLPAVRRALANVASYMIFDDHDVTDDWNLHRQWRDTVHRRPLGRRMVQNALASYAVFQAWGNQPEQFAPHQPGAHLLGALGAWRGREDATADAIRARLGLPATERLRPLRWDYQVDAPCYQTIVLDTRTQRGYRPGGTGRAAPALLSREAMARQLTGRLAARPHPVDLTIVVSAAPVFGHPLIELWIQLKRVKVIEWFKNGPARVDREAWALDPTAFEALLATLASFRRVVILSGDVHYGLAGAVQYRDWQDGVQRRAQFVQCTSSALKNEERKTRLLGGVPTVKRVPTMLGTRVEKLLTRLTTPPSGAYLGWSAHNRAPRRWVPWKQTRSTPRILPEALASTRRRLNEPDWRYRLDFVHDVGEPPVPSRSTPLHQEALQLRDESGWSFMQWIVGRNNIGDLEFLPDNTSSGEGADLVQQSLWFDKTSIRAGDEPVRLPYTVYQMPLDPPPARTETTIWHGAPTAMVS